MTDPLRFSLLYLLFHFPKFMPMTKRWMLSLINTLDTKYLPTPLLSDWTFRYGTVWSDRLIKLFEEIGCMNLIKDKITQELLDQNKDGIPKEVMEGLERLVERMNTYKTVSKMYELRK